MIVSPVRDTNFKYANIEWPTWILLAAVYGSWIVLTLNWSSIPAWLLWLLAGYTVALHSSLQHEALHGHPTRSPKLNLALVWPPLVLWLPLELYVENHLRHHRNELVNPDLDPESFFVTPQKWRAMKRWQQRVLLFNNSFLGRMLIGPCLAVGQTWRHEIGLLLDGNYIHLGILARHLLSVLVLLYWLLEVCGIPLHVYLLLCVWPATSLMLVRSFLEHRYDSDAAHRTVMVDGCPATRLLFLNNNYHWVHHRYPNLAWYRIPGIARQQREVALERNGDYHFDGYFTIASRFLLKPWTHPRYPPLEISAR